MPIEALNAPGLPIPAGHYSHATRAGNLICVSAVQAEQTLSNLRAVLAAAGAELKDCIEVTVYLVGVDHWKEFNEIYARHFGEWKSARAVVPVGALHYGYLLEIAARAWVERD
jgi:2-iminobutanoate/2-iminopropanoate deaminase